MKDKKIGYLGPEGTYSALAANKLCAGAKLIPYPSFFTLFAALKSDGVDYIVLPIENTLNGAVTQNLDLLQESEGVYATAACAVKIEHRLLTVAGADKRGIDRIYSHPQALAQCAKYLAENFPEAKLVETASTAECLEKVKNPNEAGIVGAHFKAEGYEVGTESISDEEINYTQFLLVGKGEPEFSAQSDRVFFSLTCRHKVGALVELLGILRDGGLNMTEIESRPIKNRTGEFRFFIEIEGSYADEKVRRTLQTLKEAANSFKLLGCYTCGLPK